MKYVLDSNGNVKRDSSGNDIKVPNMVNVSANVIETIQREQVNVAGSLDYIDLNSNQLMKTIPISTLFAFNHYAAVANGDKKALSEKVRELLKNRPVPFPSDKFMLLNAAHLLKKQAKTIIYQNRNIFLN